MTDELAPKASDVATTGLENRRQLSVEVDQKVKRVHPGVDEHASQQLAVPDATVEFRRASHGPTYLRPKPCMPVAGRDRLPPHTRSALYMQAY